MAIPTTLFSAQLLLITAFVLLGLWSSTFKMAGNRWRYELYSFDFAIGAILFSLVCAYTLGAFGSDLGFAEHLMLSSKTNEALAFVGGGLFGLGNILLLSAIALVGVSFTYAIATSAAILSLAALEFTGFRVTFLAAAVIAALLAIIFGSIGAHAAEETLPAVNLPVVMRIRKSASGRATTSKPPQVKVAMKNSNKGIIVSLLGGLLIGASIYPFNTSLGGQFGLGTFAGVVVFFSGALAATVFVSFLLMNVPIHGGPISLKNYFRGAVSRHILGLLGGALCGSGILLLTLLADLKEDLRPDGLWLWASALGAALLAMALGLSIWRELAGAPGSATRSLLLSVFLLVISIGVFAMAMDKTALPPAANRTVLPQTQFFG